MAEQTELDIILRWNEQAEGFDVTMLYNAPGEIEDDPYFGEQPIRVDLGELAAIKDDVEAYGRRVGSLLFSEHGRVLLDRAMSASEVAPVQLRLLVDPKAPVGFQAIRWEAMRRPDSGDRLTTSSNIRFCRFLSNAEGRQPTPLARQGSLKALVAVANPSDIGDYTAGPAARLSAVDVDDELRRARESLFDMSVAVLPEEGKRATRGQIVDSLRDGVNALYLVCHGRLTDKGPELFLENDDGDVDVVNGASLAGAIADLPRVPTIAVLCSCQSGGPDETVMTSTAESLTTLGAAMAQAGTAVVVAMQGNVTMTTAGMFLRRFFEELNQDGIPTRATAVARSTISDRPDWFMPVLYSRLKGGAWYLPRFGGREQALFARLHTRISELNCTPIIGSGVAGEDGVLPSRQVLAQTWADRRQMPISATSRRDLASVAQYVSVDDRGGRGLPRDEMTRLLRGNLKARHAAAMPELDWKAASLDDLVLAVGARIRQESGGADSYSRLARLDLPVYVTTSWTGLLEDALRAEGKEPHVRHFDWYEGRRNDTTEDVGSADFTEKTPLVYHLFGTFGVRKSLVLTEDDYFTWLRSWMKQIDKGAGIPDYIKPPLMDSSLMFLGYVFDDWEFRMIFQAVKGFEGDLLVEGSHVGVQLEPEFLRIEREAAQEYLERYFVGNHLDIYWQTSNMFLRELEETRPRDD